MRKKVTNTMIVFPPRERFHAWSAAEAERRHLAVYDVIGQFRDGVSGAAHYDRRALLHMVRELLREKCVIMGCKGQGLHIV